MGQILEIVPARRAGDRIHDRLMFGLEDAVSALMVVVFTVGSCAGVWLASITARPFLSILPLILLAVACAVRLRSAMASAQRLQTGLRGEVLVGQALDNLRTDGAAIFHGVYPPEDKIGDIDHVIVHPAGVFVVETKALSGQRGRAKPQVFVLNGKVQTTYGDPCRQARRNAGWLSAYLEGETGRKTFVSPLVVYPGCEIVRKGDWQTPVLDAQGLVKHIRSKRPRFNSDEILAFKRVIGALESPTSATEDCA